MAQGLGVGSGRRGTPGCQLPSWGGPPHSSPPGTQTRRETHMLAKVFLAPSRCSSLSPLCILIVPIYLLPLFTDTPLNTLPSHHQTEEEGTKPPGSCCHSKGLLCPLPHARLPQPRCLGREGPRHSGQSPTLFLLLRASLGLWLSAHSWALQALLLPPSGGRRKSPVFYPNRSASSGLMCSQGENRPSLLSP